MYSAIELNSLESSQYEPEVLDQPLLQPNAAYWLTSESPVARALSTSSESLGRTLSVQNGLNSFPSGNDPRRGLEDDSSSTQVLEANSQDLRINHPLSSLHLSDVENNYAGHPSGLPWVGAGEDQMSVNILYPAGSFESAPSYCGGNYLDANYFDEPCSPYSTPSLYDDSPLQSPIYQQQNCTLLAILILREALPPKDYRMEDEDDEDVKDGKPYARLIYEALLQAPGYRMMLREIYDWFAQNTNKPRESGSNGWQNSIRHNLSMNKAFENDKTHATNARGEPKKATSVWSLTDHARVYGVQSTTRYRKSGVARKAVLGGSPDYQRQRSGAKGGRAARRAARLRRLEEADSNWALITTPEYVNPYSGLMHPANSVPNYSHHYDSSPPTPSEHFPDKSTLPGQNFSCGLQEMEGRQLESIDTSASHLIGQDKLFQQPFNGSLGDTW